MINNTQYQYGIHHHKIDSTHKPKKLERKPIACSRSKQPRQNSIKRNDNSPVVVRFVREGTGKRFEEKNKNFERDFRKSLKNNDYWKFEPNRRINSSVNIVTSRSCEEKNNYMFMHKEDGDGYPLQKHKFRQKQQNWHCELLELKRINENMAEQLKNKICTIENQTAIIRNISHKIETFAKQIHLNQQEIQQKNQEIKKLNDQIKAKTKDQLSIRVSVPSKINSSSYSFFLDSSQKLDLQNFVLLNEKSSFGIGDSSLEMQHAKIVAVLHEKIKYQDIEISMLRRSKQQLVQQSYKKSKQIKALSAKLKSALQKNCSQQVLVNYQKKPGCYIQQDYNEITLEISVDSVNPLN